MNLFLIVSDIEINDYLYLGRLLILLKVFGGKNQNNAIDGLEQLAGLDFFLRYPAYLEKALLIRGKSPDKASIKDSERQSIEANTAYYNYKPWSVEYRRLVSLLVAKDLVIIDINENRLKIRLSRKGVDTANTLTQEDLYDSVKKRAVILKQSFNLSPRNLTSFIYENFPETSTFC